MLIRQCWATREKLHLIKAATDVKSTQQAIKDAIDVFFLHSNGHSFVEMVDEQLKNIVLHHL